jgi:hypothetical protein
LLSCIFGVFQDFFSCKEQRVELERLPLSIVKTNAGRKERKKERGEELEREREGDGKERGK